MVDSFSYIFTILHRRFSLYVADRMKEIGLSYGSMFPIIFIGRHENCTQSELTSALNLDWGHCQRLVLKLESDGFISRVKCSRSYHLCLTEKGKECFDVIYKSFYDWDEAVFKDFDEEDKENLLMLLRKIPNVKSYDK